MGPGFEPGLAALVVKNTVNMMEQEKILHGYFVQCLASNGIVCTGVVCDKNTKKMQS